VEMKMWHLVVCPMVHTSIFGTCCHHLQDRIWIKLGQDKKGDQVRERTGGSSCLETEMGRRWDPRRVWGWKGLEWINDVSCWSTELLSVSLCEISLCVTENGIMNFLSSGNKVFNILEFPKCTGNAILENTEPCICWWIVAGLCN